MNDKPLVCILMGSDSDYEVMVEAAKALDQFGIPFEMTVSSAHRTPERTAGIVRSARERGIKVIIAGAGAAAHLAGVVAAETDPAGHRRADRLHLAAAVSTPCWPWCRCRPAFRWRPWPSARPEPAMPASLPCRCWLSTMPT